MISCLIQVSDYFIINQLSIEYYFNFLLMIDWNICNIVAIKDE